MSKYDITVKVTGALSLDRFPSARKTLLVFELVCAIVLHDSRNRRISQSLPPLSGFSFHNIYEIVGFRLSSVDERNGIPF